MTQLFVVTFVLSAARTSGQEPGKTPPPAQPTPAAAEKDATKAARQEIISLSEAAVAQTQVGHLTEAAAQYEKAVARAKQVLGAGHLDTGILLANLGDVYFHLKQPEQAVSCYTQALDALGRHLPREHPHVTYVVNNLAGAYVDMGRFEKAAALHLENLHVREAALGKEHPHTLLSLHNLGMAYGNAGNSKEAVAILEKWLEKDPRARSDRWPLLPVVLGNLGSDYTKLGNFDKAEACLVKALLIIETRPIEDRPQRIRVLEYLVHLYSVQGDSRIEEARKYGELCLKLCRAHFGPEHLETAKALQILGGFYYSAGKYAQAAPLFRDSLRIARKAGGNDYPEAARVLVDLARTDLHVGQFDEADELALAALEKLETLLGNRSPLAGLQDAPALLADVAGRTGHWNRAEQRLKQFLATVESRAGKDDPALAQALRLVADVYLGQDSPEPAQTYARRALAIQRQRLAADDLALAITLERLGTAARLLAKYAEAEAYYLECLQIRRKKLGETDRSVSRCLCDLGFVYVRMQRYREAETTLHQALAIAEKAGAGGDDSAAAVLTQLGRLYTEQHNYVEAEAALKRSLALRRRHEGEQSVNYAWLLIYLGQFQNSAGRFREAEATFRQSLDIFHALNGKDRPDPPVLLSGLSEALLGLGKYQEAERVVRQSLRAMDERHQANDRDRNITLRVLIDLCIRQGHWEEAIAHCTESRQAQRRWLNHVLPAMSPTEQVVYLFHNEKAPLFAFLSIALHCADKPQAAEASAEWLLNGKAVGAECLAEQMQLARQSGDPDVKQTVRDLKAVREQLAQVVLRPQSDSATQQRAAQTALYDQERGLARKLGLQTRTGSHRGAWVSLAEVRKAIPAGSVLIEIAKFPRIDFDVADKSARPPAAACYVAWVIPPAGSKKVRMVDLGDAATIDTAVAKSRLAIIAFAELFPRVGMQQAAQVVVGPTSFLADQVYKPLREAIGDASNLLISPDGGLWLFPWEALPADDGKFLVEQKQISYLVTGRALLDERSAKSGSGAVLFADPDYYLEPSGMEAGTLNDWVALIRHSLGSGANAGLLAGAKFERRNDDKLIDALVPSLQGYLKAAPVVHRDKDAREETFKAMHGPRVLILATHGYFVRDQLFDNLPLTAQGQRAWAAINQDRLYGFRRDQTPFVPEPLLRCGLALAGANHYYKFRDANDGILTGLEILGTDLQGTELVVLNACETGVGAVRDGEGTAGLHQAFQLAGARAVVASLWSIPVAPSNRLLAEFFNNLAKGQTTAASLRQAQLSMIDQLRKTSGVAHPALWAAFTATGDCR